MVIWPSKHRVLVTGVIKAIGDLKSACAMLAEESQDTQQQRECESLAKEIVAVCANSHIYACDFEIVTFMSCLQRLKARALTCEFLKAFAFNLAFLCYLRFPSFSEAVVELSNYFGWDQLEEPLVVLFENAAAREMKGACILLSTLTTNSPQQLKLYVRSS